MSELALPESGRPGRPGRASRPAVTAFVIAAALVATAIIIGHQPAAEAIVGHATPLRLALGLLFGVLIIRFSALGMPVLVAFTFLNLSEALVRYHDFPSLLKLLVIGLAFAAWLKRDTVKVSDVLRQPLTIALGAFMVLSFASTAWSADRHIADNRVDDLLKAFAIYLLAVLLMRNRQRLMHGLIALVASATFAGLLVAYQLATGNLDNQLGGLARIKQAHIYGDVFQPRIAGPIGDPNFFAQILLIALPVGVLIAVGDRALNVRERVAWLAASAVIFVTVLVTYSRGAMIALAVMTLMALRALHVHWRATAAMIAVLRVVVLLLPSGVTERFVTLEEILPGSEEIHRDSSFEERKLLMSVAFVMFAANPVFGVGAGNYTARYDDYVAAVSSEARQYAEPSDLHYPHNLALEIASEAGLLGLLLMGAAFVIAWRSLRRTQRALAERDPRLALAANALRIALAGFLVAGLFLHLATPRHLLLLFAFVAALEREAATA